MTDINVNDQSGPPVEFLWRDGQKQVYTDNGSRVDIYEGGQGRPDGPGHSHYWANFNQQGDITNQGGRP